MMPKKSAEHKRSEMIGVKVDKTTKAQIEWLASRDGEKASTYIYNILTAHIKQFEKTFKTNIMNEIRSDMQNKNNE